MICLDLILSDTCFDMTSELVWFDVLNVDQIQDMTSDIHRPKTSALGRSIKHCQRDGCWMPDSWKGHHQGSCGISWLKTFRCLGTHQTCGSRATIEPWSMERKPGMATVHKPCRCHAWEITVNKNYGKNRMKKIQDASRISRISLGFTKFAKGWSMRIHGGTIAVGSFQMFLESNWISCSAMVRVDTSRVDDEWLSMKEALDTCSWQLQDLPEST